MATMPKIQGRVTIKSETVNLAFALVTGAMTIFAVATYVLAPSNATKMGKNLFFPNASQRRSALPRTLRPARWLNSWLAKSSKWPRVAHSRVAAFLATRNRRKACTGSTLRPQDGAETSHDWVFKINPTKRGQCTWSVQIFFHSHDRSIENFKGFSFMWDVPTFYGCVLCLYSCWPQTNNRPRPSCHYSDLSE